MYYLVAFLCLLKFATCAGAQKQENSCQRLPCGPNSSCKEINKTYSCACLPEYIGQPPNCRSIKCYNNSGCPRDLACANQKCIDPCLGTCGKNAKCSVVNHSPICQCLYGYTGDPFTSCESLIPIKRSKPCSVTPCGPNAFCREQNEVASCICNKGSFGDPYVECRPECFKDSDCAENKACLSNECRDPCPGSCGLNAECVTVNRLLTCSCINGYTGNPYIGCNPITLQDFTSINPCNSSPCGPYSQCRVVEKQALCSCMPGYPGVPPYCNPGCLTNSDCATDQACINKTCADPCLRTCGQTEDCRVVNHICSIGLTGDPFTSQPKPGSENETIVSYIVMTTLTLLTVAMIVFGVVVVRLALRLKKVQKVVDDFRHHRGRSATSRNHYEMVNYDVVNVQRPGPDISERPQYPLPQEALEENEHHYNTVYDHRLGPHQLMGLGKPRYM